MQDKLKPLPCPHCPKSITEAVQSEISNRWQVYCGACGSSSGSYRTEEEAIVGWNRRAADKTTEAWPEVLKRQHKSMTENMNIARERGYYDFAAGLQNTITEIEAALASVEGV